MESPIVVLLSLFDDPRMEGDRLFEEEELDRVWSGARSKVDPSRSRGCTRRVAWREFVAAEEVVIVDDTRLKGEGGGGEGRGGGGGGG